MYCRHCMRMIDDNADFCPACGKPQKGPIRKPIYKRWWFWVIVAFLVIGIGAGSDEPEIVNGGSRNNSTPQYFSIGDTARLNNVYVTFDDAYETNGSQYFTPASGNVFVICEFTIDNQTNSELNISSLICFDAYVDDYATNLSLSAESSFDANTLDGTIAPGKKMNGIIGYEVPSDWSIFEIRFTPDFWSGDEDFIFAFRK